jgi:hypothetical protein
VRVSRATFLQAFAIAILGARVDAGVLRDMGAGPSDRPEPGRQGGRFRIQDATAAVFLQLLNTSFAVRCADRTRAQFVLAEVFERPVTRNVEQFSVIFHAPAGTPVCDGTHAFQHPALGDFELFIVPVGPSNLQRTVYQACFSRHLGPGDVGRRDVMRSTPPSSRT